MVSSIGVAFASMVLSLLMALAATAVMCLAKRHGFRGVALALLTVALAGTALAAPRLVGGNSLWGLTGSTLLFLGVLTLVNAPFDWLTIGLTRALLRRGLERGKWWPVAYGVLDLVVAIVVLVALAVTALWAVQLFNHLTVMAGGEAVLDPDRILAALADPRRRFEPEYLWLYAMLFSTLVPSVFNVMLGALSLARGVPGLSARIANEMAGGVVGSEKLWMVPALTVQALFAWAVGIAVMLGSCGLILVGLLPRFGVALIPMLRSVAGADYPAALLRMLGIG